MTTNSTPTDLLQYAGRFRVAIIEYGLHENTKTGSVGIRFWCRTLQSYGDGKWHDYEGYRVQGYYCIVDKSGAVLEENVRRFREATGWDGNFLSISNGQWVPSECQITVEQDTYKERPVYRVQGVYPFDHDFTLGNVSQSRAEQLMARYGSVLRPNPSQSHPSQSQPSQSQPSQSQPTHSPKSSTPTPPTPPPSDDSPTDGDWEGWAWKKVFSKGQSQEMTDDDIGTVFRSMVDSRLVDGSELTETEWREVAATDPKTFIPF